MGLHFTNEIKYVKTNKLTTQYGDVLFNFKQNVHLKNKTSTPH